MTDQQQPQMDPLMQAQGENQKLKMVLENMAVKLARREVYISELETDNQVMFNQLQQTQAALQAAGPTPDNVTPLFAVPDAPDDADPDSVNPDDPGYA